MGSQSPRVRFQDASSCSRRLAALKAVEGAYLDAAIEASRGNLSQAARLLGISRSTLYSRLEATGRSGAKLDAPPTETAGPRNGSGGRQ